MEIKYLQYYFFAAAAASAYLASTRREGALGCTSGCITCTVDPSGALELAAAAEDEPLPD